MQAPEQGLLQLPQCAAEVSVLVSHPLLQKSLSQSAVPVAHVGAAQMPAVHVNPAAQSEHFPQPAPSAHFVAQLAPQSTSLSLPFFTPSLQLGAHEPATHDPPTQSASIVQPLVGPHL
jgi:hypothetical protein